MNKSELERQLSLMEAQSAQDREKVRAIIKNLTPDCQKALFLQIGQGRQHENHLSRFIYVLADVGLTQVLTEWNHYED